MRKTIMGLLLAATVTSPLAAQEWQGRGGERRENRQEQRQDRREIRQDRQAVQRSVQQGNRPAAIDAQRELRQDRRELQQDNREAQRDNRAFRNGTANSWAERQRDQRADRRDGFRGDERSWNDRNRFDDRDRRNWNNDRGRFEWRGQGRWDNRWRNDNRYDWQGWRNQNRGIFRLPRYSAPRGYSYRRWSPGYRIEPFFYGRSYWISDPWRYRLPPAYGDYRWVRYYDDVALVDIRTGLIADILYSFFW